MSGGRNPKAGSTRATPTLSARALEELVACYNDAFGEVIEIAGEAEFPETAVVQLHPPADAPQVGRYPMKDLVTVTIGGGMWSSIHLRTLRAMVEPTAAVVPGSGGWWLGIVCPLTGGTLAAYLMELPDWATVLARLTESQGRLNFVLEDARARRAGLRRLAVSLNLRSIDVPCGLLQPGVEPHEPRLETFAFGQKSRTRPNEAVEHSHYRVEVALVGAPIVVRRVIAMPIGTDLEDLHLAIQRAFGFENCHLWSFSLGGRSGARLAGLDDGEMITGPQLSRLHALQQRTLVYTYDFGDNWQFSVKLGDGITLPHPTNGTVLESQGPNLVEDIGGLWGLSQLIADYAAWRAGTYACDDESSFAYLFEQGWSPEESTPTGGSQ